MRRFRLCTLKRRVRLSRGLPRSAPATLHLQDPGFYICLSVRESFSTRRELRNTQGLPIHDSVNSLRGSLFAGLLASDLSTIDPTRRIANGLRCNLTPPERHWHPRLCARAFLASPWANGSMSVCLGSSAAGGPASESGTSFTAHASAHDPKVSLFSFVSARWAQGEFDFFRGRGC